VQVCQGHLVCPFSLSADTLPQGCIQLQILPSVSKFTHEYHFC
jgi:hypothetical protein